MTNKLADFKNSLKLLSPQEQISKINFMINEFNKTNNHWEDIARKFRILNELKTLKKQIISNHKTHLH